MFFDHMKRLTVDRVYSGVHWNIKCVYDVIVLCAQIKYINCTHANTHTEKARSPAMDKNSGIKCDCFVKTDRIRPYDTISTHIWYCHRTTHFKWLNFCIIIAVFWVTLCQRIHTNVQQLISVHKTTWMRYQSMWVCARAVVFGYQYGIYMPF